MDTKWDDYHKTIQELPPSFTALVDKPTDLDLDAFEKRNHFRLPLSYRSFVKLFGPGQLAFDFTIRAPGYVKTPQMCLSNSAYPLVDIDCFNLDLRSEGPLRPEVLSEYADPDSRVGRLVFFADNTAGDLVGWDTLELLDAESLESAIYMVLGEEMSIRFLASSFFQFIDTICYDKPSSDAAPSGRREPDYRVFRPASFPPG
jgi:hypothetical protein